MTKLSEPVGANGSLGAIVKIVTLATVLVGVTVFVVTASLTALNNKDAIARLEEDKASREVVDLQYQQLRADIGALTGQIKDLAGRLEARR